MWNIIITLNVYGIFWNRTTTDPEWEIDFQQQDFFRGIWVLDPPL